MYLHHPETILLSPPATPPPMEKLSSMTLAPGANKGWGPLAYEKSW